MSIYHTIYFYVAFLSVLSTTAQELNELIVSEIMVNPKPSNGLPEKEYLELYNRSDKTISLYNLRLQINNTTHLLPNTTILPKEYVLVCKKSDEADFAIFGKVVGISSLSLSNAGASVHLKTAQNKTLFYLRYSDKWYKAGYSLEMIDTNYPCVEEGNWTSSIANKGGTPAQENSVRANKPDLSPPELLRYELSNPTQLKLVFSEKLDSISAISRVAYSIDNNLIISNINIESPENKQVNLYLNSAVQEGFFYTLTAKNIEDCSGNLMKESQISFGKPIPADSGDVIINEILFNPRTGGKDFVEIFNRSDKLISLKSWRLANLDKNGKIANHKTITTNDYVLQPKDFLVLTENASIVQSHYTNAVATKFLEMSALPSFPDKEGSVLVLNQEDKVFDQVNYSETWHSSLIDDPSGVSLERKYVEQPSNEPSNWQSAAATDGYATPGYENSQSIIENSDKLEGFSISPIVFTPDGDGVEEVTYLSYQFLTDGNFVSIRIFDIYGRRIRQLTNNQLIGTHGRLEWDGTNDNGQRVSEGYYILLAEVFNPKGKNQLYKLKVVVGSK